MSKKRSSPKDRTPHEEDRRGKRAAILVAIDFSHCSLIALRKAKSLASRDSGRLVALHVIDHHFVQQCIHERLGTEREIKKKLFLSAKARLRDFLRREGLERDDVDMVVCEGTPCVEINKAAVKSDAQMVVMGSKGNSDDMQTIFFGSTTEKVLRFIRRPVLCVPPDWDYKLK